MRYIIPYMLHRRARHSIGLHRHRFLHDFISRALPFVCNNGQAGKPGDEANSGEYIVLYRLFAYRYMHMGG